MSFASPSRLAELAPEGNALAPRSGARVVIVGAGHAGATAAALLRQAGFEGEVVLLGDEPTAPYERPPLSKSLLGGDLHRPLFPPQFYGEQRLELRLEARGLAIDRERRVVELSGGERLAYDALILATGASVRGLDIPGSELEGVFALRTLADARRIEEGLQGRRRLAIVGGGWIGLEVAAAVRVAGLEVTVLEREPRLLARVSSPEFAEVLAAAHRARGVEIVGDARVAALLGDGGGGVGAVALEDGRSIEADLVLVAVGAAPNLELARDAGLVCDGGVVVDASARSSDPAIYAIGDMTARPVASHGGLFRFESIPSATEQARQAVAAVMGRETPAAEVPWFWSDQFDLKVRIAGVRRDATELVTRTAATGGGMAIFHLRDDRLLGVETVDAASEFTVGRRLIRDGAPVDPARLGDSSLPLEQSLLARRSTAAAAGGEALALAATPPAGAPDPDRSWSASCIQPDGAVIEISVAEGATLMEAAVRANVAGIVAECGGTCSCATCHVYVDEPWFGRLQPPDELEADLLAYLDDHQDDSRLSCQIAMRPELDGIVVRVAPGPV